MKRVYISSTYADLQEYRTKVYDQLRKMDYDPCAMEDYAATEARPLAHCLADVAKCDIYIAIIAWHYGYVPKDNPENELSITELEYNRAGECRIPGLVFILDVNHPWPQPLTDSYTGEGNSGAAIREFRNRLQRAHITGFYTTPEDLANQVSAAITNLENKASIAVSTTLMPNVPQKNTVISTEKSVAELSQTPNNSYQNLYRYDFFIAYASPDRHQAKNLCWFLQDYSCRVFLDVEDLRLGTLWQSALKEALEESRAILVLWSTHTDNAFYQQEEISRAIQLARDTPGSPTVIPVILEKLHQGAISMPYGMSIWQGQDATRAGGLRRVAAELVAWLEGHQDDNRS